MASWICCETRRTGLSTCCAPWNTTAASAQRTARSRPGFIASTSSPASVTDPVDPRAGRHQPQQRHRHRRLAAAALAGQPECLSGFESQRHAANSGYRPAVAAVGHVQVVDLRAVARSSPNQPRVEDSLERVADQGERQDDADDAQAGRQVVPPRVQRRAHRWTEHPPAPCPSSARSDRRDRGTPACSRRGSPPARSATRWR